MEAAGLAAFEHLQAKWPKASRILIVSGKGNNGGDGYIIARLASQAGLSVTLCHFCPREQMKGDAQIAFAQLDPDSLTIKDWSEVCISDFDLVVDALLGTGITGPVREPFAAVIESINQSNIAVLAIDIPSGLNADTGQVANVAIDASLTVTYIGFKRGLYTGDAASYRGQVVLADLAVPAKCFELAEPVVNCHNWKSLKSLLKPRKATSHKGDFGHCKIIGGCEGMAGAAVMAATAAARCGAGLTSAWLQSGQNALIARTPEVMASNVSDSQIESLVVKLQPEVTVVLGPGLGRTRWGHAWMRILSQDETFLQCRKVLDADALNWLAENPLRNNRWILTPHPGEAGRLLGVSTQAINADRFTAAKAIAEKYGGICVLKGAGTIVSDAHGKQSVCAVGNPGMASGGMGDVLSGIIASLVAQNLTLFDAAQLGVAIHGEAADRVAGYSLRYRGLLASDLFQELPALLNP